MGFALFQQDPLSFVIWIAAIVIALTVHEYAHALMASYLGDDTAEGQGRLTLNPMSHIDPIGFFALIFVGFGWGRPVPYDATKLKNPRLGSAMVALAGPVSNLIMALIFVGLLRLAISFGAYSPDNFGFLFLVLLIQINFILLIFNLIPIPPLDGSQLLLSALPDHLHSLKTKIQVYGPFILLFLIIFDSSLPVPILGSIFSYFFSLFSHLF